MDDNHANSSIVTLVWSAKNPNISSSDHTQHFHKISPKSVYNLSRQKLTDWKTTLCCCASAKVKSDIGYEVAQTRTSHEHQ